MSVFEIFPKKLLLQSSLEKSLLKTSSVFLLASVSTLGLSTSVSYSSIDLTSLSPTVSQPINATSTRLLKAVEEGKYEEVENFILDDETLIHTKDRRQNTLLHLAIQKGHHQIINLLLDENSDVKAVNRYRRTPLHEALLKMDKDTLKKLLRKCIEVNAQDQEGNTALHIAVESQSIECILPLIRAKGMNPLLKNKQGLTVQDIANQHLQYLGQDISKVKTIQEHLIRYCNLTVRSLLEQAVPLLPSHIDLAANMMQQNRKIFFSYCWNADYSTKPMVEDFEKVLKDLGITNYYRDVREEEGLGMVLGTHIETFMQNAKQADAVVIFLNDAYLRSRNCMYEFLQIWDDLHQKISPKAFVIRHPDFNKIFGGPNEAVLYERHWKEFLDKLQSPNHLALNGDWNRREQQLVTKICRNIIPIIEQLTSHIQADYQQLRSKRFEDVFKQILRQQQTSNLKSLFLNETYLMQAEDLRQDFPYYAISLAALLRNSSQVKTTILKILKEKDLQLKLNNSGSNPSEIEVIAQNSGGIQLMVWALNSNPTITNLNLYRNNFGNVLCEALSQNTTLQILELQSNQISDEGAKAISQTRTLKKLYLWYNNIGIEGAKDLALNSSLTILYLGNNNLGNEGAKAFRRNTFLTHLQLWKNNIAAEGAEALAQSPTLKTLELQFNQIGKIGAKALSLSSILTNLNLQSNSVGDEGAEAFGFNTNLNTLGLGSNNITDGGIRGLALNRSLTDLDLRDNHIGNEGTRFLAHIPTLTRLYLSGNQIGDEGALAFAFHPALIELHLKTNQIGDEGAKGLSLHNHKKLIFLDLSKNRITENCKKLINEYMQSRPNSSIVF